MREIQESFNEASQELDNLLCELESLQEKMNLTDEEMAEFVKQILQVEEKMDQLSYAIDRAYFETTREEYDEGR